MIIEHNDLSIVLEVVAPHTLVLFDLDNTLIKNAQSLGSPEWFTYFHQKLRASGLPDKEAYQEVLATYLAVNKVAQVELVCEKAPPVLTQLHLYASVGFLTAREVALVGVTLKHLQELELTASPCWERHSCFSLKASTKGHFTKGAIFTGGADKCQCLLEVLGQIKHPPDKVVFVDDQEKSLLQVQTALEPQKIPFLGIRYYKLDAAVASLSPEVCDVQLEKFWLEMLNSPPANTPAYDHSPFPQPA